MLGAALAVLPVGAAAGQGTPLATPAAGEVAAGMYHACAMLSGAVRCWGYGGDGALGYGDTDTVGDDETPGSRGTVNLGAGRSATAITAGSFHSCALLDDGTVRCWGYGGDGRLGYANTDTIGDDEAPGTVGPVDLGPGRTAKAISAGGFHTCAVLDDGTVRCWGYGFDGQLGYGGRSSIGDDETPGSAAAVKLGSGRTATALSTGGAHTCARLDDATLRCWGFGGSGRLGYGNSERVGTTATTTPDTTGPVDLGPGRTAAAVTAGGDHTCAVLDDRTVRCWGFGGRGRLGYGSTENLGDVRTPGSAGPVDIGAVGAAKAISAGDLHTCAMLVDTGVRCWGHGTFGRLGLCRQDSIGDDEAPASAGPVHLAAGTAGCPRPAGSPAGPAEPSGAAAVTGPAVMPGDRSTDDRRAARLNAEAVRGRNLRICLSAAARRPRSQRVRARAVCLRRHGRIPGRVTKLSARVVSRTQVVLTFHAPGSDGAKAPAARGYLVKQSRRPIRDAVDFDRAPALCRASCRFRVSELGARIRLTITDLRPRGTYYYAIAARDNVSNRRGPRSATIRIRTQ